MRICETGVALLQAGHEDGYKNPIPGADPRGLVVGGESAGHEQEEEEAARRVDHFGVLASLEAKEF